ncbi:two-component system regulatory protein YycI [Bacillus sp. UMB0893]|uniref:two-component system regulatory protein YycI n=1 Tax=Bacillus sp. UMB0893 TaxID=2066053 RepID=UPI0015DD621E|nr:two-component system regulatory protein YycI [Bacillus sp. UMB0893]QNG59993.1 two-component system regulatory protein YycI [Bacillus sp. PAMC26568]
MDWSKTKSIFILAFLVLNTFLAFQYFNIIITNSRYDVIQKPMIEEQLAAEGITYGELPKGTEKGAYIAAESKVFSKEELKALSDQEILEFDNKSKGLVAEFEEPISLPETNTKSKLNQIIRENILYGDEYVLWKTDKTNNTIVYIQTHNDKMIFQDLSDQKIGMLILYLNDKNQIVSYEQTMLENIEDLEERQDILPALKALEALYNKNDLKPNSKVTEVQFGYYSPFPLSGEQILAPTWHIVVNEKEDYYVNALEGQVIRPNEKLE